MARIGGILVAMALLALTACGGSGFEDDFQSDNIIQRTIEQGVASRLTLTSGAFVDFPGNIFEEETIVIFSDLLTGTDGVVDNYPVTTPVATDLLAAIVINTPVDEFHDANLPVRFAFRDGVSPEGPGTQYAVYRFDFDNNLWYRWGATVATVDASGDFATATLPTDKLRGFVGSLALFDDLTTDELPAPVITTIEGRTVGGSSAGFSTSVSVYYLVGSLRFPVELLNGSTPPGGTFANVVNSDADGDFLIQVPDHLVGALIGFVFGEYDDSVGEEDEFDLLAPATPDQEVQSMVVRYGENNVISQPIN